MTVLGHAMIGGRVALVFSRAARWTTYYIATTGNIILIFLNLCRATRPPGATSQPDAGRSFFRSIPT